MDIPQNLSFCSPDLLSLYSKFIKECTAENIDKIQVALSSLESYKLEIGFDFLIFPFEAHLMRDLDERLTLKCIKFFKFMFEKCPVNTYNQFVNIFRLLFTKLDNPKKSYPVSEELKSSVCQTLSNLLKRASHRILNGLYSLSFRPCLAHAFYTLNNLLLNEKSKSLRKEILDVLGILVKHPLFDSTKFCNTRQIASESLGSVLPGLSIALQKVICGDTKQGSIITALALKVLKDLISLVLSDYSFKNAAFKDTTSEIFKIAYDFTDEFDSFGKRKDIPVVIKNEKWFEDVSSKIEIIVKYVVCISNHYHHNVRLEFVHFIEMLILECSKTLGNCSSIVIPYIFCLSLDDNKNVKDSANKLIDKFSKKFMDLNSLSLTTIIEQNISEASIKLMKSKITSNDTAKLAILKTLLGCLQILGPSTENIISKSYHLEEILLSVMMLLEFDTSMVNIVEEVPFPKDFDNNNPVWPKKKFRHFEDERILEIIVQICHCLANFGNCRLLADYLLDKMQTSELYTLQCIYLIGSLIKELEYERMKSEQLGNYIIDVMDMLFYYEILYLPVSDSDNCSLKNNDSLNNNAPDKVYNSNILQICLLLEVIANCAIFLKKDFELSLLNTLCPVMEKAGSSNFLISQSGQICLHIIAKSCQYLSVSELIMHNADYITSVIILNSHSYLLKPEIAVVLHVAMEHSVPEALPLFRDLILKFLSILDYNHEKAYPLMSVMLSVINAIKKWHSPDVKLPTISKLECRKLSNELAKYVNLKHKTFNVESEHINQQSESNDDDNCPVEEKEDLPLHVSLTCEIFKRCIHFQSSDNPFLCMLILEIVESCVAILQKHELQLHPLIHEFWSRFVNRFNENTFIAKAFDVLLLIASVCEDFVRVRTLKDILPKLIEFLKKEQICSQLPLNFKSYQWTCAHKLQNLVLAEIGNLCTKFYIDERDICIVVNICLVYLEKNQPLVLQQAAAKSLEDLAEVDPDAVWFYWREKYSKEKTIPPPNLTFYEISFSHSNNALLGLTKLRCFD